MDKKNEDVAMVAQIDKTSVFQEGTQLPASIQYSNALSADPVMQHVSLTRAPSHRGNAEL